MKLIKILVFTTLISFYTTLSIAQMRMDDPQINSLIGEMTLEEKVSLVHGSKGSDPSGIPYAGYVSGIQRLSIPPLTMQNGPSGAGASFGDQRDKKPATAFPVSTAQASTWNKELLREFGRALGLETKAQGRDVLLGPGLNIVRVPEGGRNFEYFSEDPHLSGQCAVAIINGIQETGIMASAKHYTANNQETWRHTVDERIPERALRELYLPAFEATVKEAEVATLMSAFNKVNGTYCSEHPLLLREIAKEEWGFKGFIMTDWGTRHSTVSAANAGLDMEMSGWGKFGEPQFRDHLADAVRSGRVRESVLDEMVYRILHEMKRFGHLGGAKNYPQGRMDTPEHRKLARQMAEEGAVLLKNAGQTLPLDAGRLSRLALFGDADKAMVTGGGSSRVVPFYRITPVAGLKQRLDPKQVVHYKDPNDAPGGEAAVVYISRRSTETADRESISLASESTLIEKVASKYKKTIVMLRTPGAYTMPWIDHADAVFQMWYPGQEEGNVEAALLFGDVSPSGKLPVTFGREREDYPATTRRTFPGIDTTVYYSEGIFVGYRYFEHHSNEPLFAFGHGLSYTSFEYSDLKLSSHNMREGQPLKVSFTITNTGRMKGSEAPQL